MPDPYLICPACEVAFDSAETRRSARGLRCPNCGQVLDARGGRLPLGLPVPVALAAILLVLPIPPALLTAVFVAPNPEYLWVTLAGSAVAVLLATGLVLRLAWVRVAAQFLSVLGAGASVAAAGYFLAQGWGGAIRIAFFFYALLWIAPALAWCGAVFALLQMKATRTWFARPYRFDDED
ncbi:MAG: hypothetical protein U0871_06175 [Gemmataceae bacterium]